MVKICNTYVDLNLDNIIILDLKEEVSVAAFADIMPPSCYMLPSSFAAIGKKII